MKKQMKRLLGVLLALAMVLSLMPEMSRQEGICKPDRTDQRGRSSQVG